jgi:hypothetical protein
LLVVIGVPALAVPENLESVIISVRMARHVVEHTDDDNAHDNPDKVELPSTSALEARLEDAFVPPTTMYTIDPEDYSFATENCHRAQIPLEAGESGAGGTAGAGSSADAEKPSPSTPAPQTTAQRKILGPELDKSGQRRSARVARQQRHGSSD